MGSTLCKEDESRDSISYCIDLEIDAHVHNKFLPANKWYPYPYPFPYHSMPNDENK